MKYDKKLKEKMLEEYTNTNITRKEICTKYNVPFETFRGWLRYDHSYSYGKKVIKKRSAGTSAVLNRIHYQQGYPPQESRDKHVLIAQKKKLLLQLQYNLFII